MPAVNSAKIGATVVTMVGLHECQNGAINGAMRAPRCRTCNTEHWGACAPETSSRGGGGSRPARLAMPVRPAKPPEATGRTPASPVQVDGAGVASDPREAKRGRPRVGEPPRSHPWEAAGMSRRTWFRRQAEARAVQADAELAAADAAEKLERERALAEPKEPKP